MRKYFLILSFLTVFSISVSGVENHSCAVDYSSSLESNEQAQANLSISQSFSEDCSKEKKDVKFYASCSGEKIGIQVFPADQEVGSEDIQVDDFTESGKFQGNISRVYNTTNDKERLIETSINSDIRVYGFCKDTEVVETNGERREYFAVSTDVFKPGFYFKDNQSKQENQSIADPNLNESNENQSIVEFVFANPIFLPVFFIGFGIIMMGSIFLYAEFKGNNQRSIGSRGGIAEERDFEGFIRSKIKSESVDMEESAEKDFRKSSEIVTMLREKGMMTDEIKDLYGKATNHFEEKEFKQANRYSSLILAKSPLPNTSEEVEDIRSEYWKYPEKNDRQELYEKISEILLEDEDKFSLNEATQLLKKSFSSDISEEKDIEEECLEYLDRINHLEKMEKDDKTFWRDKR